MRPSATKDHRPAPAFRWAAVLCALTVWVMGLLAASPQLHAALHSEANHQDHTCAITLFSHGVEEVTGPAELTVSPLAALDEVVAPYVARPVWAPRYWLLPGRAPPVG